MARVKKGVNAHKRLPRGESRGDEITAVRIRWKKAQKERLSETLDRPDQRWRENERHQLQPSDGRTEEERNRNQQKNALRDGDL